MPSIRIAAAQSISVPGDVEANLRVHAEFIAAARKASVDLLVFPELSLSGYELQLLRDCIMQPTDSCLAPIRDMVRETQITVVLGAPVDSGVAAAPSIGAITFFPDGRTSVYRKQFLHPGEEKYVTRVAADPRSHGLGGERFSLAICADTSHEQHAAGAAATGASLYLAGVLVPEAGYLADAISLRQYASRFNFGVLMSNHGGPSGGHVSAGKSAFWAPGGELVVAAPGPGSLLVVVSNEADEWSGELLAVGDCLINP